MNLIHYLLSPLLLPKRRSTLRRDRHRLWLSRPSSRWANRTVLDHQIKQSLGQRFGMLPRWLGPIVLSGLVLIMVISGQSLWFQPAIAQLATCQLSSTEMAQKQRYLKQTTTGDPSARSQYETIVANHSQKLKQCRAQTWPATQGIWLRLYPCDAQPGELEAILDHIVDLGYNEVNVEVFYSGQVLLPATNNPTPWPSIMRGSRFESSDLLAAAIQKGHARGLKVYAWVFTMNFGYSYASIPNRQRVIARNGLGQTSLDINQEATLGIDTNGIPVGALFIDPYHPTARSDFLTLVNAIAQRRPDGVLFDYVRYPKGKGSRSIATKASDLWIYGEASRQVLYQRALNNQGAELIQQYLAKGYVTVADIDAVYKRYPNELEPLWHGRIPLNMVPPPSPAAFQPRLQQELWNLAVAHAVQGVLDFLNVGIQPLLQARISAGGVFFPYANQVIGQGYDSRLQAWDRFPTFLAWHPMAYATCNGSNCIVDQVRRVMAAAPQGTQVKPIIAGDWGRSVRNRPPLESQMQALQRALPQLTAVSHFAYSWQEPDRDQRRRSCRR